jgi:hypothetical protein
MRVAQTSHGLNVVNMVARLKSCRPASRMADVSVVLLHERIVPLAEDQPRAIIDDHAADWASTFVKALLRKQHGYAYEILVLQFVEKSCFYESGGSSSAGEQPHSGLRQ